MTTKKYKIIFSIFNLFEDTQAEVVKLQQYVKTTIVGISGMTWYNSNATYAIYIGLIGIVLDTLLSCIRLEKLKYKKDVI
jgi:hypothetical protein